MTASEQPPKRDEASQEDKSQSSAAKWTAIGVIATALFTAISAIAADYFGYLKFINPSQGQATPAVQPKPTTADVLLQPRTFDKNHSSGPDAISIESMPLKVVYYFSGVGDPKKGNTGDGLSVVYGEDSRANYRLNYVLPADGDGWVGLAFVFSSKQNLADFKYIEVKMTFDTGQTYCRLFIKDNTDTLEDSVPLKLGAPLQPDIAVSITDRTQTLKIPLDTNFEHVNPVAITEVDFDCDTNITRGDRTFTVNSIRFLKP